VTSHLLDDSAPHAFWDRTLRPRVEIEPGDTVVFKTREGTGQVTPESRSEQLARLDPTLIHALNGPVAIRGAEPGDVLVVDIVSLEHGGWGWNGVIPGFGLLADDFTEPYIHHYELDGDRCNFNDWITIPFEPFCGTMGVALDAEGRFDTAPPRRNGGNIDIRQLTPGSQLRLPVLHPGALFSCGDCHAAQGDGEVNGTGIETPMTVTLRFDLEPAGGRPPLRELQFRTAPRPLTRADTAGYYVTTAHGPDLFANSQQALRYMLDHLVDEHGLTREQAYCLSGAAVDLKISEIVDEPNYIVSAFLPLSIFSQ
jgi:acetamidase/formamidase